MKRTLISFVALATLAAGLAAAPHGDLVEAQKARIAAMKQSPKKKPHVAFVSNGVADFWTIAKAGAIAAGKEIGCDVTVEFPGGGLSDQKRMLEDLVTRGIDGVSVSPIDPTNQADVLNLVAEKSLLITNDSDAPKSPRLCYIGMDNYDAGLMCGKLAREGCTGGEVAIFIGRLEQDNAKRRRQGFIDGLLGRKPDPTRYDEPATVVNEAGYTIVGTWTDSFDRAKAKADVVTIGGPANFAAVQGSDVAYATNSTLPLLSCDGLFYLCQDGAWFKASAATGPWALCDSVPARRRAVALEPVLVIRLVACCVIAPASAHTSMLPLDAPVLVVRRSASAAKVTEPLAMTLRLPDVLDTSALTTTLVPFPSACKRILPVPCATTAA